MSVPTVTITPGIVVSPGAAPLTGKRIQFTLLDPIRDGDDDTLVAARQWNATLDETGALGLEVKAPDGTVTYEPFALIPDDLGGTAVGYRVVEQWRGGEEYTTSISVADAPSIAYLDLPRVIPPSEPVSFVATQQALEDEIADREAGDGVNAAAIATEATARADGDALLIPLAEKAAPDGVATLDGSGTIPDAQIPATVTRDSELSAAISTVVNALLDGAPGALDTLNELAAAVNDDASFAASVTAALALKAPLASPALTGNPTAPTPSVGDNDTSIATTGFVTGAIAAQHTADSGTYLSVGQTKVDVTGKYAGDIPAAITAEGHGKQFVVSSPATIAGTVTLGDYDVLEATPAATLTAAAGLAAHVITNVDATNGNSGIRLLRLTIDGNKANRAAGNYDNILLTRVSDFTIDGVETMNALRHGAQLTGASQVTRVGKINNSVAHDNTVWGWWVSAGMRQTTWANVHGDANSVGFVWDASECEVVSAFADSNTSHGHAITNVWACQYFGLKASRNGGHGIIGWAMIGCRGGGWVSYANSVNHANTYDDVNIAVTPLAGFTQAPLGTTVDTVIDGISCGKLSNYGMGAERYGLYVEDGLTTDTQLLGVHIVGGGGTSGSMRLPTAPGRLIVREAAA